jgi:hypothetical protein
MSSIEQTPAEMKLALTPSRRSGATPPCLRFGMCHDQRGGWRTAASDRRQRMAWRNGRRKYIELCLNCEATTIITRSEGLWVETPIKFYRGMVQ